VDDERGEQQEYQFTKNDYLNTAKPYEALYAIKNPFEQQQAAKRMAAHAAEQGVKGFGQIWQTYRQTMQLPLASDATSDVADQPVELHTGNWTVDDFGVRRGLGINEQVACGFPIYIVARFEDIDDGTEKVEIAFKKNYRWKRIIIRCGQYADPNQLVKLADVGLNVNRAMAQNLSDYLTDIYGMNYQALPEHRSVHRLGWVADSTVFSPYVENLVYDGDPEYKSVYQSLTSHGSFAAWTRAAIAFRKESIGARVMLAASFASVLVQPLEALPFFVHLWGVDSGTGKTVALMAAASVWANPAMGKYVKTFDGTDVGYERMAAFLNSLPLCIDESQIAEKVRGRTVFNVYRLAQGAGRMRGTRTGGIDVTPTWGNAILTTGEGKLTDSSSGAGAVNRVVHIECSSAHKVVQDGHATVAAFNEHYGWAGRYFVEQLSQPGALDKARALHEEAIKAFADMDTTDKQAISAGLIVAADKLATDWIFHDGNALTAADLAPYLATSEEVSTGKRGYDFLLDWVAQNEQRFMRPGYDPKDVCFGVIDDAYIAIIKTVFANALRENGFNPDSVLSYLAGAELIAREGRNLTCKKMIGSTRPRCVCLYRDKFDYAAQSEDELDLIP
jgi:hypothetical protein